MRFSEYSGLLTTTLNVQTMLALHSRDGNGMAVPKEVLRWELLSGYHTDTIAEFHLA
jgi:hypothetical protein